MTDPQPVLADLVETIDWPDPSPHLSAAVRSRIETSPLPSAPRRWRWALVAAAVAVVSVFPGPRQAVADLIVEAGVRLGLIDETPTDLGSDLQLGDPVTLDEAAATTGLHLQVPADLGSPDAVYVVDGTVSMIWSGTEGLPAAAGTDVAVLLGQGPAGAPYAQKGIGPETVVEHVPVGDEPGIWIEGAAHTFTLLDDEGIAIEMSTRLAANVLLWTDANVEFRLELTGGLDQALSIATSLEET